MDVLTFSAIHFRAIRDQLKRDDPELDEETLADTVEGLTNLHDLLAAIIRFALIDEALATGLRQRIEDMEERLRRFDERAAKRRHIVRDAMVENELKKITDPEFTVSIRSGSPALVVVDEAIIPAEFWEPREPRLDRHGLLSQLKQGAPIAGVQLSNPEPVLSVRTK